MPLENRKSATPPLPCQPRLESDDKRRSHPVEKYRSLLPTKRDPRSFLPPLSLRFPGERDSSKHLFNRPLPAHRSVRVVFRRRNRVSSRRKQICFATVLRSNFHRRCRSPHCRIRLRSSDNDALTAADSGKRKCLRGATRGGRKRGEKRRKKKRKGYKGFV